MGRAGLGLAVLWSAAGFGQEFHLGARAAEFKLTDPRGVTAAVDPAPGNATVVLFISAVCPMSNDYVIRINDLYRDYSSRGVRFLVVNSNQNEEQAQVDDHARRAGFLFPVYRDPNNAAADRFGAQSTPEAFLLDGGGIVRYHGRIDDARNPARVKQRSLRLAIDAVLEGREVAAPETKAFGCVIKRARKTT
ncbi:MAG TPA: redoxin domain-containing protein [Bryobacteraceae bacterium]|jgi:peroxiredoxin|nr:redoxin domain-containing protein [Bryobacteraceae bacterium]